MKIAILAALLLHATIATAALCGKERADVKLLRDQGASSIEATPTDTTIDALRALHKPSTLPNSARIKPTELQTYRVHGMLIYVKHEDDGDYHVVLADEHQHTIIVEFPDPHCMKNGTPQSVLARQAIEERYHPTDKGQVVKPGDAVTVIGVGFFDKIHGQRGVAGNGIEIHPVMDVQFQ